MIKAYQSGIPENGKPFPNGSKMVKIHWNAKKNLSAPGQPTVPGTLHDVDVMVRDSARFPNGNWGYAPFLYDNATSTFRPEGTGADCGTACHTAAKARDFVFTAFPKR
jgi:hypothetical protein